MNAALCSRRVAGCSLLYRGEGRGGRGCKAREEGRKEAVEENVSGESFKLQGRGKGWFEETGWKNSFGFLRLL